MTPDELLRHLESLLFVSSEPSEITQLAAALDVPLSDVESAIDEMSERCKWRGIRVQRKGQRVQFASSPEAAPYVEKYLGLNAVTRLSQAALETLAIIAYRQPITRPEIEVLRGVDCDGVLRTLTARQLIVEVGRLDTVGHPIRYGTTFEFLRYFGLERLDQLPNLHVEEPIASAVANNDLSGAPGAMSPGAFVPEEAVTDEKKFSSIVEPADTRDSAQPAQARSSSEPTSLISIKSAAPDVRSALRESQTPRIRPDNSPTDSGESSFVEPSNLSTGPATGAADAPTAVSPEHGEPAPSSSLGQPGSGHEATAPEPDHGASTSGDPTS